MSEPQDMTVEEWHEAWHEEHAEVERLRGKLAAIDKNAENLTEWDWARAWIHDLSALEGSSE